MSIMINGRRATKKRIKEITVATFGPVARFCVNDISNAMIFRVKAISPDIRSIAEGFLSELCARSLDITFRDNPGLRFEIFNKALVEEIGRKEQIIIRVLGIGECNRNDL